MTYFTTLFLVFLLFTPKVNADESFVDLCELGYFGNLLARETNSDSCGKVSIEKLNAIEHLYSRGSTFGTLGADHFKHLKNLKYLGFSALSHTSFEPHTFSSLKKLVSLRVTLRRGGSARGMSFKGIENLPNLKSLELYMPLKDVVHDLKSQSLKWLYFDSVQPITFDNGTLAELPNLETLTLKNAIKGKVPDYYFSKFKSLQKLELGNAYYYREPSMFNETTFYGLTNLSSLKLDGFKSKDFESLPFQGLKSLKKLSFESANSVNQLPVNLFKDLVNLEYLEFIDSRIGYFPLGIFQNLESLEELILYRNTIDHESLFGKHLKGLKSLKKLSAIPTRGMVSIPTRAFIQTPMLKTVGLGNISHIANNAFYGSNVSKFYTEKHFPSGYTGDYLRPEMFNGSKLEDISICGANVLRSIEPDTFKYIETLKNLRLEAPYAKRQLYDLEISPDVSFAISCR